MKKRIPVQVSPGMFSSERYVVFQEGGREYSLFVDADSVQDGTLEVQVVESQNGRALIELPRDTNAGSRVFVASERLLPA
ncbi:MAG: hypothetical protein JO250_20830 [Armatimonadetes bacterium]|nr:hypothetical protein [Armatimonadota bacterium]